MFLKMVQHASLPGDGQCLWSSFGGFSYPESCDLPGCACASWRLALARFYYTGWHLNRCWHGPDMVGWYFHSVQKGQLWGRCTASLHKLGWTHSLTHTQKLLCASFTTYLISLCVWCVVLWCGVCVRERERERWIKSICTGPEICLCSLLCSWHILLFWDYII